MEIIQNHDTPQFLRVRCPQCFKIYSVNGREIQEAKPRFECVQCKSRFWLAFPECRHQPEVIGFPINWLNPPQEFVETPAKPTTKECPKCRAQVPVTDPECASCGIVIEKYLAAQKPRGLLKTGSKRLTEAWQAALEHYDNEELHQTFLRACQGEDNLAFALQQYNTFLEVQPTDPTARKMREATKALLQTKVQLPKWQKPKPPISWLVLQGTVILSGLALLALGFWLPEYHNVMGFGAALMFLSIVLQRFKRPRV